MWKAHGIRQLPRFGRHQPQGASLQHFGVKAEPLTTSLSMRSTPEVPARSTSGERIGRTFPRRPRRAETPPPAFLIGQERAGGAARGGARQAGPRSLGRAKSRASSVLPGRSPALSAPPALRMRVRVARRDVL